MIEVDSLTDEQRGDLFEEVVHSATDEELTAWLESCLCEAMKDELGARWCPDCATGAVQG